MTDPNRDIRLTSVEHAPRIRRFFASKGLAPDEIEDLTQDVLLSVIESYRRFEGRSSISTWIYSICRNVFRTHIYRLARARSISKQLDMEREDREEIAVAVRSVIEKLPVVYQHTYALYYENGLSIKETSEKLSRPEGTVKYLLSELRKRFRAEWQ